MQEFILTHDELIDQNSLDSVVFQFDISSQTDDVRFYIFELPETSKYGDPNSYIEVRMLPKQFKDLLKTMLRFDEQLKEL